MKIYLTDQKNKFKQHLEFLKTKKVMDYDKSRLTEKITTIEVNTTKKIHELNLDFLFNYQVFPDNILTHGSQWTNESRKMKTGDTIVQQVCIPPLKPLSQKIIFGVRICEMIEQVDKVGFSYETLEGHVEKGISTFTLEPQDNSLIFKIQTYSAPGNTLTKILGPFISLPYQAFCTTAALRNVKRQIENQL